VVTDDTALVAMVLFVVMSHLLAGTSEYAQIEVRIRTGAANRDHGYPDAPYSSRYLEP